jgi:hypothetical protein
MNPIRRKRRGSSRFAHWLEQAQRVASAFRAVLVVGIRAESALHSPHSSTDRFFDSGNDLHLDFPAPREREALEQAQGAEQ